MPHDPAHEQILCRLDEIPDGRARGFLTEDRDDRLFVVRRGERLHAWLNCCPHECKPLDFAKDQFLNGDGSLIVCYAHGAHFDVETGEGLDPICEGDHLVPVPVRLEDGAVIVPLDLPAIPRLR